MYAGMRKIVRPSYSMHWRILIGRLVLHVSAWKATHMDRRCQHRRDSLPMGDETVDVTRDEPKMSYSWSMWTNLWLNAAV